MKTISYSTLGILLTIIVGYQTCFASMYSLEPRKGIVINQCFYIENVINTLPKTHNSGYQQQVNTNKTSLCGSGYKSNGYGGCMKVITGSTGNSNHNQQPTNKATSTSCGQGFISNGYGGCKKDTKESNAKTDYNQQPSKTKSCGQGFTSNGYGGCTKINTDTNKKGNGSAYQKPITSVSCNPGTSPNGFGGCSLDQKYQYFDSSGKTPYRWNQLGPVNPKYQYFDSSRKTPYRWNGAK